MDVIWQWIFSIITLIGTTASVFAWWNVRSINMFQKKLLLENKLKLSRIPLGEKLMEEAKFINEREIYTQSTKKQVLQLCIVLEEYRPVMTFKQRRMLKKLHYNISYFTGRKNYVGDLLIQLGSTFTDLDDILEKGTKNE